MHAVLSALRNMGAVRSLLKQASDGPDCGYRWMRGGRNLHGTGKTILAEREKLCLTFRRPAQR